MTDDLLTEAAVRFVQAGAEVVMRYFGTALELDTKGAGNLVSDADLESEQTIVGLIHESFPGHAILAEERGRDRDERDSPWLWIVDPLDGTNNFVHRIPQFAVCVALYEAGVPRCGVVFNPVREDLYVSSRGGGAFWNGRPIRVASETRLADTMVGTGFYYNRGELMQKTLRSIEGLFLHGIHGIRRFGCASLDLCAVASGQFGAFFEYELAPWDFAAGRLIVEEAGGKVTDCRGEILGTELSSVLASNGILHESMLKLI